MVKKQMDVRGMPDLLKIAEEVRSSGEVRVLTRNNESLAVLMPVAPRKKRGKTKADFDAFMASAGSWKDLIDTEQLVVDIRESRRRSTGPVVEL